MSTKLLEIRIGEDPVLRQVARGIDVPQEPWVRELALAMGATMRHAKGVGLAAPQVGESVRLIVVDHRPKPRILINPVIVAKSEATSLLAEGCLSIPGVRRVVRRSAEVEVAALSLRGESFRIHATGQLAFVLQHEIDHLDGVLITDHPEVDVHPEDLVSRRDTLSPVLRAALGIGAMGHPYR